MNEEVRDLWARAMRSLLSARMLLSGGDPDAAASRAYYTAFIPVALFALEGKSFGKHAAVAAAVHRDLVRTGRVPVDFGAASTALMDVRSRADYGGRIHVSNADPESAIASARMILRSVGQAIGQPSADDAG